MASLAGRALNDEAWRLFWRDAPRPLARRLLGNSVAKAHLLDAARLAAAARPDLAAQFLLTAWLRDPLDGSLARQAAALPPVFLPPGLAKAATVTAAAFRPPDRTARLEALEIAGDYPALRAHDLRELSLAPGNLFWRWHLWFHALAQGDAATAFDLLEGLKQFPPLTPLGKAMEAAFELLLGKPAATQDILERQAESLCPWLLDLHASASLARGDADRAVQALSALLERLPWRFDVFLRRRDLLSNLAQAVTPPTGKSVAICLYSYNKAQDLDATLHSLAASDLGDAIIRLLDNGSGDATASVCEAWAERWGERCRVIRPPVNVGAAPARNWLLSLPEVRERAFVAFLDDDVEVSADWLGRLLAGLAAFPGAGVAGARVLEHGAPHLVQQTEQFLAEEEGFALTDGHREGLDLGQFSHARPCLSVTGCCHLLRREALEAVPAFDIRYSPTQYDDVDHDLALTQAGWGALYQGHCRIAHKKRSGRGLLSSPADSANAAANFHKLREKWKPERERLRDAALAWSLEAAGLDG